MEQVEKIRTASNSSPTYSGGITIKSPEEIRHMRLAGKVVATALSLVKDAIQPGITTRELDSIAYREIVKLGGKPTFHGYRGFPATICASVNNEIVHGIPGDRVLSDGDILKVDIGATVNGFIGDTAISVGLGTVSEEASLLIDATKQSLYAGITAAVPGARTGDIGAAIEGYIKPLGYGLVREYVGHGVGRFLHEDPQIPNYGPPGRGPLLRQGMAIAIEPMVNIGGWKTKLLDDQWTVVTNDGSLSAHFEHTILITDGEPEILTNLIETGV